MGKVPQPHAANPLSLESLKILCGYRFLAKFAFSVYYHPDPSNASFISEWQLCESLNQPFICNNICHSPLQDAFQYSIATKQPVVGNCPMGLLYFVIALPSTSSHTYCLMGSGVRDEYPDLYRIEEMASSHNLNPLELLDQLYRLPMVTRQEVVEAATKLHELIPSLLAEEPVPIPTDRFTERLHAVTRLSEDIDRTDSIAEAISLLSEAMGILFDIPFIAAALPDLNGTGFSLQVTWGAAFAPTKIAKGSLQRLFPSDTIGKVVLMEEELTELLPGVAASFATCIPLEVDREFAGLLALFDVKLHPDDILLAELLTGRVALRLKALKREEEFARKHDLSQTLVSMFSTLVLTEEKEALFTSILTMAAQLARATSGSVMLFDEDREYLHIAAVKGMNSNLAQSLRIKPGAGIAGRVASGGKPLLVNDIEKDERIASINRPRFKTKSFISMPLKFKDHVLGVLNLSDKEDQRIFTEADLEILTSFVEHASAMIDRSRSLEGAAHLERLSVTDPLTELYNRRFLEKRMEEEISRSIRNGLHLTIMLIDLDNFKIYNDLCGHLAGDKALQKASRILRESVREMDVVTRYGGEEFCVILPATSKKESLFVAERIRRGIENTMFIGEEKMPLGRLTTSLGLASFPEDGNSASAVINAADIALYRAKSDGRNRIIIYGADVAPLAKVLEFSRQA